MNSIERENFFDYLSAMYAENANCHFCALREKCQAKDNMGKCYERVLSELMEATKAYPSAEKWVDEMNELQIREKKLIGRTMKSEIKKVLFLLLLYST